MPPGNKDPLLRVVNARRQFRSGGLFTRSGPPTIAVDGITFDVVQGEVLAIVGESGCGKSTLARLLMQLIEPDEGEILYNGKSISSLSKAEIRALRSHVQMVFQDPLSSFNPRRTVGRSIEQPLQIHTSLTAKERRERALHLLELVRLTPGQVFVDRHPHQLSGGQLQRAAIARALATEPSLIIADEPVASLDVSVQAQVLSLLLELRSKMALTIIFISHDLGVVRSIADRVAVMYMGKIVDLGATADVMAHPAHPYTRALIDAAPVIGRSYGSERILLQGGVPSARNPPPGCRFHTRCPIARNDGLCNVVEPPLKSISEGHHVACHFAGAEISPQTEKGEK